MGIVHMVLQGPGGVGKSFVASALVQGMGALGMNPIGVDIDPINPTLSRYKGLQTEFFKVMEDKDIDRSKFDELVQQLTAMAEEGPVIVDSGGPTFVPLTWYLRAYGVGNVLADAGHRLVLHTVLSGGQSQGRSDECLYTLCRNFASAPLVVWINPFRERVLWEGQPFEESALYEACRDTITTVVKLPELDELSRRDVDALLKRHVGFEDAIADPTLQIMRRQRLRLVWRQVFEAVELAVQGIDMAVVGHESGGLDESH